MAAIGRPPRPYRDFLTPALHRRFTKAALLTLGVCYFEAVWMSPWDLIWQWFPIGLAGVRTLLLFVSVLALLILRVAQMHVGKRTSTSPFQTLWWCLFSYHSIQTLCWYLFSAWWFSEVYIWSAPPESRFNWTEPGRSYERPLLNERPIYMRTMFICLGVFQSAAHFYYDYDELELPASERASASAPKKKDASPPSTHLRNAMTQIVHKSAVRALMVTIAGTLIYSTALRYTVWRWTYSVVGSVYNLAKMTRPTRFPGLADLMGRFLIEGFLLIYLWEVSNSAFSAYAAQEPLKKDRPLTDDSKDPNGSLLSGLKAKKVITKSMAYWELALITQRFPLRRKSLFRDVDRKDAVGWKQILAVCLAEIESMGLRLQEWKAQVRPSKVAQEQSHPTIKTLPRLSQPLKDDNIVKGPAPPSGRAAAAGTQLHQFAKSYGQSPGADPISPRAKKLIELGTKAVLSKEQQESLKAENIKSQASGYMMRFIRSPLGWAFRKPFRRRAEAVIGGSPHSGVSIILDAIDALTGLCVRSVSEDDMGTVYKDVPHVIRTFVGSIRLLETFLQTYPIHWTDVEFRESDRKQVYDANQVIQAFRHGLEQLMLTFGEYLDGLDLSAKDIRAAKEIIDSIREQ